MVIHKIKLILITTVLAEEKADLKSFQDPTPLYTLFDWIDGYLTTMTLTAILSTIPRHAVNFCLKCTIVTMHGVVIINTL